MKLSTHLRTSGSLSKQTLLAGMQLCPCREQGSRVWQTFSWFWTHVRKRKIESRSQSNMHPACTSPVSAPPHFAKLSPSQFPHQLLGPAFELHLHSFPPKICGLLVLHYNCPNANPHAIFTMNPSPSLFHFFHQPSMISISLYLL